MLCLVHKVSKSGPQNAAFYAKYKPRLRKARLKSLQFLWLDFSGINVVTKVWTTPRMAIMWKFAVICIGIINQTDELPKRSLPAVINQCSSPLDESRKQKNKYDRNTQS